MTLLGFGDDNLVFLDLEFSYVSIIGASISVFLGIVMTQSGFDKIFNWEGELDFITGKFAKTPLANFSTFGLIQVTIFEILSLVSGCTIAILSIKFLNSLTLPCQS